MKRKIAAALAAILVAGSLSACGGNDSSSSTATGSSSTADSKTDASGSSTAATGDTLSFKCTTADFGKSVTGTPIQNEWQKMMEAYLGKKLDIQYEYINYSDYKEKLQVLIAGGNLPDLMTYTGMSYTEIPKYGEKGVFLEVSSKFDSTPNYKAAVDRDPNAKDAIFTPEGKSYAFYNAMYVPSTTATVAGQSAVRNRVLKENDLKIPTTLDEMYTVAKTLKEKGVSNYPIALYEQWQSPESTIYQAYHLGATGQRYFDGTKYAYAPLTDDYKLALQYLNKIYTEGLISPDYFTQTSENGSKALSDGSACILPAVWEGYPAQWTVDYPTEEWVLVPQMTSDKYPDTPWAFVNEVSSEWAMNKSYSIVISAKSKLQDELVKLVDYQYSDEMVNLLNWGIKDSTYKEAADGTKEFLLSGQANKEALVATGLPLSGTCRAGIFPQVQDMDLWRIASADPSPIYWEGEVVVEKLVPFAAARMTKENTSPLEYAPSFTLSADENEQYANIMAPVETFSKEQKVKFIKGERSFDDWDNYIAELNKMGDIQAALELYNSKIK